MCRHFEKDGLISHFLKAANLPLRMLKSGNAAIVSYQIVVPEALSNILVLDASFPIRKLCHYDTTIKSAETLPGLKRDGVPAFHSLKKFDNVELFRLKSYGGRFSMEKRFKDRQMAKEVVQVLKTIPADEAVLLYVYKMNQPGGIDYKKILLAEISKAGIDTDAVTKDGKERIVVSTWGNETSLNCYAYCQHVFLVGILHRDDTEIMGQYLGQIDNLQGEISKTLTSDLSLSERAHLAYQALSRGIVPSRGSRSGETMKGYIVEIDPQIETALSTVMPGVTWKTWTPFFMQESDSLIDTWRGRVEKYLSETQEDRVSSRRLKAELKADKVAPDTWTRITRTVNRNVPKKESYGELRFWWSLKGGSFVRITAESYGFCEEVGYEVRPGSIQRSEGPQIP